jgi:hypothetical protein
MPVPDFSPGEIFTAGAADSIGLWLVKTQTVTGTPSTVVVNDAFSADFTNYLVVCDNMNTSAVAGIQFRLGASTTAYYWGGFVTFYATAALGGENGNNVGNFATGIVTDGSGVAGCTINLFQPFASTRTTYNAHGVDSRAAGAGGRSYSGLLNNTTSHTSITFLLTTAATFTSGTIRVYGYRN